jgi:hypothetical protein
MLARVAARRGAQALPDDLEAGVPRCRCDRLQPWPGLIVGHRGAVALELVAGEPVVARAGVEAGRGDLGVQAGARYRRAVNDSVGARLVRRLVGGEAQVALLAEHPRLAAEGLGQLVEHRLEATTDRVLVEVASGGEVGLGVVALEAGEPLEHLRAEALEGAVLHAHVRTGVGHDRDDSRARPEVAAEA